MNNDKAVSGLRRSERFLEFIPFGFRSTRKLLEENFRTVIDHLVNFRNIAVTEKEDSRGTCDLMVRILAFREISEDYVFTFRKILSEFRELVSCLDDDEAIFALSADRSFFASSVVTICVLYVDGTPIVIMFLSIALDALASSTAIIS